MDFTKILFKANTIDAEKELPDGVIYCTKDGKIQWVNDKASEMFETPKINLKTSNISDFIENAFGLISNALINDRAVITKLQNQETYFEMTVKESNDGYTLDFRDIESSKNINNRATVSREGDVSRDKDIFLSKLSNDFKSPLQSIIGFSQAMADGLGGNMTEQQEKYIKIIKKNSSDLMYFTEKLLDLSKSEALNETPEIKKFDILNMANSVVRFNEQMYTDKDIRWNVVLQEGMKSVISSDESYIKKILQNILEVILKSVEMGEITIEIQSPDDDMKKSKNLSKEYVLLSITSSSLLLSESDLEMMFDPYKIIDSPNRKNLLRAMTLATAKNLVQVLNGVIWVESKILKNTAFNVLVPQN